MSLPTIALILATAAALLCIWGAVRATAASINPDVLSGVLLRLLHAGNLDRMRKLSHAIPAEAPVGRGLQQVLARVMGEPPQPDPHGYRDGGPQTLSELAKRELRATYDEATRPVLAALKWSTALQSIGAAAALAAALLVPPLQRSLAGVLYPGSLLVVAGALLWGWNARRGVRAGTERVFERIVRPLVEEWIAGRLRSHNPPRPRPERSEMVEKLDPGELMFEVLEGLDDDAPIVVKQNVIKIGRADNAHVCLPHPSVARLHAVIEVLKTGAVIIDLGNPEGTKVNGKPVNKVELKSGDLVQMGEVIVRVSMRQG